jgi:hypothetical protein
LPTSRESADFRRKRTPDSCCGRGIGGRDERDASRGVCEDTVTIRGGRSPRRRDGCGQADSEEVRTGRPRRVTRGDGAVAGRGSTSSAPLVRIFSRPPVPKWQARSPYGGSGLLLPRTCLPSLVITNRATSGSPTGPPTGPHPNARGRLLFFEQRPLRVGLSWNAVQFPRSRSKNRIYADFSEPSSGLVNKVRLQQ